MKDGSGSESEHVTEREMSTQKQHHTLYAIYLCVLTLFCQFLSPTEPNPTKPIFFLLSIQQLHHKKIKLFHTCTHRKRKKRYIKPNSGQNKKRGSWGRSGVRSEERYNKVRRINDPCFFWCKNRQDVNHDLGFVQANALHKPQYPTPTQKIEKERKNPLSLSDPVSCVSVCHAEAAAEAEAEAEAAAEGRRDVQVTPYAYLYYQPFIVCADCGKK